MAEIINLNRVRKAKKRDEKNQTAQANRIAFGRTKAEKQAERKQAAFLEKSLDGKKLTDES